jgi:hypothetical protein
MLHHALDKPLLTQEHLRADPSRFLLKHFGSQRKHLIAAQVLRGNYSQSRLL